MPCATVPEHAAARSSIRACHTQVSEHAAPSSIRACCTQPILALAQPLPAACQSPPSIRTCRAQQYIRPSMPRTQVSEHAVRSSIRGCRAQHQNRCCASNTVLGRPGLSLREASVGEEALPMDKAGGVLRRSLLWKPVAKRNGPQRLAPLCLIC